MKRKIRWRRVVILVGGIFILCLLGAAALFTIGQPLLSTIRASMWTVDPVGARQAAQELLNYQLPEGYQETKYLRVQGSNEAVIMTSRDDPGGLILLRSIPDGIRQNDSWRKRYEEGWSDDLDGHRYRTQTVEIRGLLIDGLTVPVRVLEGKDERGKPVKQAVCIVQGKHGEVLAGVMNSADSWDIRAVESFYQSIQK